jgi:hypothetical protein
LVSPAVVYARQENSKTIHGHKIPWSKRGKTEARQLKAHYGLWKEKIRSENYNSAYKPAPKLAWEKIGFLANQDLPVFPANSRESG